MRGVTVTIIDDNLVQDETNVRCRHCDTLVGVVGETFLGEALWRERGADAAGSSVMRADPSRFVDRAICLRQAICPGCYTLLLTEVVPTDEESSRRKELAG